MPRAWIRFAIATGCVVAALVHSPSVCAQTPGVLVGYTGSDQSAQAAEWYPSLDFEATQHPTVGLLLSFDAGFWRWEPRANYTFKGRESALDLNFYNRYDTKTAHVYDQLEYLSLQSDFHLKVPVGSANFYAVWAPRLDVLLSQETGIGWPEEADYTRPDLELTGYSPTVFGMALGLGQDIQVGRHTMFLEARYDFDLEAAWTLQVPPPFFSSAASGPVYNRTLLLQLGFRLWTSERKHVEPGWPRVNPP